MTRCAVLALGLLILLLPGCSTDRSKAVTVTSKNFEETVLQSKQPVFVDFWADWCGPCKQMDPIIRELASEFEGKVVFAKINIDDYPEIPRKYDVEGFPTFLIFKDGQIKHRFLGMRRKDFLTSVLLTMQ